LISLERLKEVLDYNPETGLFIWKISTGCISKGNVAGCPCKKHNYRLIRIDKVLYRANRLAWFYMTGEWPENDIDHKDTDKLNDKFENLRPATRLQNQGNHNLSKRNSSGFKGVHWSKRHNRWVVKVGQNYVGEFLNLTDAALAYNKAAKSYFGEEFARINENVN